MESQDKTELIHVYVLLQGASESHSLFRLLSGAMCKFDKKTQ
jgi:hypothetical protein